MNHETITEYIGMDGDWNYRLLNSDGDFSIRTASEIFSDQANFHNDKIFKQVWKIQAPQIIRSFCRLAANDALLTNANGQRKHLVDNASCAICGFQEEIMLHVICDCIVARNT